MTTTTLRCGLLAALLIAAGCGSDGGSQGTGGSGGKGTGGKGGGTGGAAHTGGTMGTGGASTGGSTGTGGLTGMAGTTGSGGAAGATATGGRGGGGGGAVGSGGSAGGGGHAGSGGHGGAAGGMATGGHAGGGGVGGSAGAAGGGGHPAGGAGGGAGGGASGAGGGGAGGGMGGMGGMGGVACMSTGGVGGTAWLTPPVVPAAIDVPSGATVKVHDRGIGAQVYTCLASTSGNGGAGGQASGPPSWVATPSAILYDATCTEVGTHQEGPSWTSGGGTIKGMKLQQADSSNAANIAWLLLKVTMGTTTGPFAGVTYVQRVNTVGGLPPSAACNSGSLNTQISVPYSADYYFFTGGSGAGGAGGSGS
ncbi:MAG: DUF3455 domain-containing protein [Pseudomonadota bacterium]